MKLINVIDENGKSYSSTYVKRAKGLVKHDRAYWVDESTICLRVPLLQTEEKTMKATDFERMIALTVAGNYAIKNKNKDDYHLGYSAIKALCDTYDGIILELEKSNIEIVPGLEKIGFDLIPNRNEANKLRELEQCVYTKNCLLNPILKLEKSKLEKNEKENFSSHNSSKNNNNVVINVKNKCDDILGININEIQALAKELQKLTLEQEQLLKEKKELEIGLKETKEELANSEMAVKELYIDTKELDIDIKELSVEIENLKNEDDEDSKEELEDLEEELEEQEEELESKQRELEEILEDIEEMKEEIKDYEGDIQSINIDLNELQKQISSVKKELTTAAKEIKVTIN